MMISISHPNFTPHFLKKFNIKNPKIMKPYIMTSEGTELEKMLKDFLLDIDDEIQKTSDLGLESLSKEFSDLYSHTEHFYRNVIKGISIDSTQRNKIRISIKHYLKQKIHE